MAQRLGFLGDQDTRSANFHINLRHEASISGTSGAHEVIGGGWGKSKGYRNGRVSPHGEGCDEPRLNAISAFVLQATFSPNSWSAGCHTMPWKRT